MRQETPRRPKRRIPPKHLDHARKSSGGGRPLGAWIGGALLGAFVLGTHVLESSIPSAPRPAGPLPPAPPPQQETKTDLDLPPLGGAPGQTIGRVALVIDDLGGHLSAAERLFGLGIPLTIAVLPGEPHSRTISREAALRGHDVLLHQPMEPADFPRSNPGPRALLKRMSPGEQMRILRENLDSLPEAIGINNHMGSAYMRDRPAVDRVMEELRRRGQLFLDSVTAPRSAGYWSARRHGVPAARRDVFLDPDEGEGILERQFVELARQVANRETAIAIGHPHPETLDALDRWVPRMREAGIEFVKISEVVNQPSAASVQRSAGEERGKN
ncbi:MAG: divergent polysaccharide deacetylase family protein [Nitrospirota bacterium]